MASRRKAYLEVVEGGHSVFNSNFLHVNPTVFSNPPKPHFDLEPVAIICRTGSIRVCKSRIAIEYLSDFGCDLLEQSGLALFDHGHQKHRLAVALFFPKIADVAFLFAVVVRRIDLALVLQRREVRPSVSSATKSG